jgi:Eukaryotic glutathione synthase, ATP binding domain
MTETSLVETASSWCASHGVLMGARDRTTRAPLGHDTYEPAPFSLYPTPFSKTAFESAYSMAKPFNGVVHKAASSDWLQQAIAVAAQGDREFTGKLVDLAKEVVEREARGTPRAQKVVLGILR